CCSDRLCSVLLCCEAHSDREDRVIQTEEAVAEGRNINLTCTYEGAIRNIQWYRQYQRSRPEFLLYITEQGQIHPVRSDFSAHINSKEKQVDLQISSAAVSDSAVYYCALEPTVTGNTKTLYKNLWSKDNTILHNIHQREPHTVKFKEHHTAGIKSTNVRDINQCPSSPMLFYL
uniref:Ig-like domain-containing protein n=1 Tax=Mastacembelus armatus TaxID=205130 RepID=A0A3Q3LM95_9TELE